MSALARLFIGFLLVPAVTWAQGSQDTAHVPSGALRIRTNVDGAFVYLDGTRVGRTPLALDSVPAGIHLLRILPADTSSWLFDPLSDTLRLEAGESKEVRYLLSYRLLVNSIPSGATVYCRDTVVGTTPMLLTSDEALRLQALTLKRAGYETLQLSIAALQGGSVLVPLERAPYDAGDRETVAFDGGMGERNWTPVFLSGGGAIVLGGLAAYFKIAADEKDASFRASGIPSVATERSRLDAASAVATAAMELCLVYFVYRLLQE